MPKNANTVARLVEPPAPDVAPSSGATGSSCPFVAECIEAQHPVLAGRVRARWVGSDGPTERWVPALRGVAIRERPIPQRQQRLAVLDRVALGVSEPAILLGQAFQIAAGKFPDFGERRQAAEIASVG